MVILCPLCLDEDPQVESIVVLEWDPGERRTWDYPGSPGSWFLVSGCHHAAVGTAAEWSRIEAAADGAAADLVGSE